jgi:hypothetical protein
MDKRILKKFMLQEPFEDLFYYRITGSGLPLEEEIEEIQKRPQSNVIRQIINPKIFQFIGYKDLSTLLYSEHEDSASKLSHLCLDCGNVEEYEGCDNCDEGMVECQWCEEGYNECGDCGGEGVEQCGECDGDGEVVTFVTCETCEGSGDIEGEEDCDNCGGDGEVEKGDDVYECVECDGTGTVNTETTCEECDGEGQIEELEDCDGCDGYGTVDCEWCENGYTECGDCGGDAQEECSQCQGWYEPWVCENHNPVERKVSDIIQNPKYKNAGISFRKFTRLEEAVKSLNQSKFISLILITSKRLQQTDSILFNGGRNVTGDETIHIPFTIINNVPPEIKKEDKLHPDKKDLVGIPVDGESNKKIPVYFTSYQINKKVNNSPLMIQDFGFDRMLKKVFPFSHFPTTSYVSNKIIEYASENQHYWLINTNIPWESVAGLMNWNTLPF